LQLPRLKVFLDIDGTIACQASCRERDIQIKIDAWKSFGHKSLYIKELDTLAVLRPGLSNFLNEANKFADLYIFTAGGQIFADQMVSKAIDPTSSFIKKAFAYDKVTHHSRGYTKDLRKLGAYYDPKRSVLIDDCVDNMVLQPHNGIQSNMSWAMREGNPELYLEPNISTWKQLEDFMENNSLADVLLDLQNMAELDDVRPYLEKKYQLRDRHFTDRGCAELDNYHHHYLAAVKVTKGLYPEDDTDLKGGKGKESLWNSAKVKKESDGNDQQATKLKMVLSIEGFKPDLGKNPFPLKKYQFVVKMTDGSVEEWSYETVRDSREFKEFLRMNDEAQRYFLKNRTAKVKAKYFQIPAKSLNETKKAIEK
jgi:hypothetical protein